METKSKLEKYRQWDAAFAWPIRWKREWIPKHGSAYYLKNARVEMDDPDMPF